MSKQLHMYKKLVQGIIDFTGTETLQKDLISKVFTCTNTALRLITIKNITGFSCMR